MIALENKYRYRVPREIHVVIAENIIELQNIARIAGQDKQNEALKPHNLKIIVNYLRNWLNHNFFNYFSNIDKKFTELIRDILKKIKTIQKSIQSNSKIADIILNLNIIDGCASVQGERKTETLMRVINLINTNISKEVVSQEELDKLAYYLNLNRFDFIKFKILNLPEKTMERFIQYLLEESKTNQKFLCISHGSFLKHYFELPRKLYNTEMVEQECTYQNTRSGTIIPDPNLVSREKIVDISDVLSQLEKCGKICGIPQYKIDSMEENKMFAVISKMSLYDDTSSDPVIDRHVDSRFKVYTGSPDPELPYNVKAEERPDRYFKKYINLLK